MDIKYEYTLNIWKQDRWCICDIISFIFDVSKLQNFSLLFSSYIPLCNLDNILTFFQTPGFHLYSSSFLIQCRTTCLGIALPTVEWACLLINWKKTNRYIHISTLIKAVPHLSLSFQRTLGWAKLTVKVNQDTCFQNLMYILKHLICTI